MTPNVEAINELADFIENCELTYDFNATDVSASCGTAGCSAGHAALLWEDIREAVTSDYAEPGDYTWDHEKLADKLGLSRDQHDELFWLPQYEDHTPADLADITKEDAVATLRRFASSGETYYDEWVRDMHERRGDK